jgi:putative transposase
VDESTNRAFYLPRLPREFYQADAVVFWTLPISQRQTGWLSDRFHLQFRELLLHACVREHLFCPTYCLMPDHLHLLWMGLQTNSDQLNAMAFLRTHLKPVLSPAKFQHQAHDHALAEKERKRGAFSATCFYILNNAVRAKLVTDARDWHYSGAVIPGYPKMNPLDPEFWPKFWKLYCQTRDPDCLKRTLPPRSTQLQKPS